MSWMTLPLRTERVEEQTVFFETGALTFGKPTSRSEHHGHFIFSSNCAAFSATAASWTPDRRRLPPASCLAIRLLVLGSIIIRIVSFRVVSLMPSCLKRMQHAHLIVPWAAATLENTTRRPAASCHNIVLRFIYSSLHSEVEETIRYIWICRPTPACQKSVSAG